MPRLPKENLATVEEEAFFTEALRETLDYLKNQWFEENVGIVAATLLEYPYGVTATSQYLPEEKKWLHAEAAAISEFKKRFGRDPKPTSTMVITLSPCFGDSETRFGPSCSQKILDLGIRKIRFGWLDTKQVRDVAAYQQIGFNAKLVDDLELQRTCRSLYRLFDDVYGEGGRFSSLVNEENRWEKIKEIIGLEPF